MKYGIFSLNIYEKDNNWGSILQTWALQTHLKKNEIESVVVKYKPQIIKYNTARYPSLYKMSKGLVFVVLDFIINIKRNLAFIERDNKFKGFIKKYYIVSKYYDESNINDLELDGAIIGSDIVWTESFWEGYDKAFFCDYESLKGKHNIAYAPSMGERFSDELEEKMPGLLNNFNAISVRESIKADYIQGFTKQKVESVLDPTLLLDGVEYEKFTLNNLEKKPYVFVYCVAQNEEVINAALNYAEQYGYNVIVTKCCPAGKEQNSHRIKYLYGLGIEEWLTYIKNAERVFTTSFHACIFSVLFKKEFIATYDSFGKNKIWNLLTTLGLKNHGLDIMEVLDGYQEIDYVSVYNKLEIEREKSKRFLERNLKISDLEKEQ